MDAEQLAAVVSELAREALEQRSEGWYAARRHNVGGSEVASVLGLSPYKTVAETIEEKVFSAYGPNARGPPVRYIGLPAAWGTLFEDPLRRYVEHVFGTTIHELGSVKGRPHQTFSADGVGRRRDGRVALFEFKCMLGRAIKHGQVPAHYMPQVLAGLDTLPVCDHAVYAEAIIRRAPINVAGETVVYDRQLSFDRGRYPRVYCWGAMAIYAAEGTPSADGVSSAEGVPSASPQAQHALRLVREARPRTPSGAPAPIDFGSCPKATFEHMMQAYVEGAVRARQLYFETGDPPGGSPGGPPRDPPVDTWDVLRIVQTAMGGGGPGELLGVMRWKMLDLNMVEVRPVPNYVDWVYPIILMVAETVADADHADNDGARVKMIQRAAERIEEAVGGMAPHAPPTIIFPVEP